MLTGHQALFGLKVRDLLMNEDIKSAVLEVNRVSDNQRPLSQVEHE